MMELGGGAGGQHFRIRDRLGSDTSNLNNEDKPTLRAKGSTRLQEGILTQACVHNPHAPASVYPCECISCSPAREPGCGPRPQADFPCPCRCTARQACSRLPPGCLRLSFLFYVFLLRASFRRSHVGCGSMCILFSCRILRPLSPGAWMGPGTAGTTASTRCAFYGSVGVDTARMSPTAQGPFGKDVAVSPVSWQLQGHVHLLVNGNFYPCLQPRSFTDLSLPNRRDFPGSQAPSPSHWAGPGSLPFHPGKDCDSQCPGTEALGMLVKSADFQVQKLWGGPPGNACSSPSPQEMLSGLGMESRSAFSSPAEVGVSSCSPDQQGECREWG